jgi:hypothetical protein
LCHRCRREKHEAPKSNCLSHDANVYITTHWDFKNQIQPQNLKFAIPTWKHLLSSRSS